MSDQQTHDAFWCGAVRKLLGHPVGFVTTITLYAVLQGLLPLRNLHSNDFKHIYLGMQAIWSGRDPYGAPSLLAVALDHGLGNAALNPYVYLPFTGLALGFLRPLPFHAAALCWYLLNHLAILMSGWLFARALAEGFDEFRSRAAQRAILTLYFLAMAWSHPLTRTLTAGQLNCMLLLIYLGAFCALAMGRDAWSGALLGFGAMFKLSPGIFLLHFLLLGRRRALSAMLMTMVFLAVLSFLFVGLRTHLDFLPMLRQMSYGHSTWEEYGATFWKDPWNQSPNALWTHLVVAANRVTVPWWDSTQTVANLLTWITSLALVAGYVAVGWHIRPRLSDRTEAPQHLSLAEGSFFQATIVMSLLLPSLMWDHYLVQVTLPAGWVIAVTWSRGRQGWSLFCAAAFVATLVPWRFDADPFRAGLGVLLMSMKLYPTLMVWGAALHLAIWSQKLCKVVTKHD